MNILVIATEFPPDIGGAAVFVGNLCDQLARRGHQVRVILPRLSDLVRPLHTFKGSDAVTYQVTYLKTKRRLSSLRPIYATLAAAREQRTDVVFFGQLVTTWGLGAVLLSQLCRVPFVILSHGNDLRFMMVNWVDRLAVRLVRAKASLMLANSTFTAERIRGTGYAGKVEILHPGVDTTQFHPHWDTKEITKRYALENKRILITTARLTRKKNIHRVLKALPIVIKQIPNLIYLIIGQGEEEDRLRRLVVELDMESYVRFVGHVAHPQLGPFYNVADLFIMPSYQAEGTDDKETFGISFIEASACSKPVIGGRSGGVSDAVVDGETGLLVDPDDEQEIAAAITRLLTDKALARRLGENGRRRAVEELSWEKVAARFDNALLTCLSEQRDTIGR